MKNKISHRTKSVIESFNEEISSLNVITDFFTLYKFVEDSRETASKQTHYHKLDTWSDPIYAIIHKMLKKYKFINGGVAMGKEQNVNAKFWWQIYGLIGGLHNSPNLPHEDVANHHASAWARNEALFTDLSIVINKLNLK